MTNDKIYDVVIIGAGPAGLTAGLYTARSNMSTLIIERGIYGGQMMNTDEIENYPGYASISGQELSSKMYEHTVAFGAEYAYGDVSEVKLCDDYKEIIVSGNTYKSRTIIIATGANHRHLGVTGEEELTGRGVSYCAICDGAFFKDSDLVVVGGGNSAIEESIFLKRYSKSVTIIHRRDKLRAQKILQDRAFANEKIKVVWDSVVKSINGSQKVESVTIENLKTNEETIIPAGGFFVFVGLEPISAPFVSLNILDEKGYIITNEEMETSVSGIFAAGDVRNKSTRQIVTAAGDGSIAAQSAQKFIEENEIN